MRNIRASKREGKRESPAQMSNLQAELTHMGIIGSGFPSLNHGQLSTTDVRKEDN